ncbi:MAG: hypothetical protein LBL81_04515 [Tannerella sp.]|jgi:hypothetical protein|nr:hypothetical protein [Tannerella sp.]
MLSEEAKKALEVSSSIKAGQVYRMRLTEEEGVKPKHKENDGRDKFFIVLGRDKAGTIGFVLINSSINKNLPQQIRDLHSPILASKYRFLKYDSFVDCHELKEIKEAKIRPENIVGELETEDLDIIKKTLVEDSPVVTTKQLKRFGLR